MSAALLVSPLYELDEQEQPHPDRRREYREALDCTRWVAERTRERLQAAGHTCVEMFRERIEPGDLPERLAQVAGMAFFGHGSSPLNRHKPPESNWQPHHLMANLHRFLDGGGHQPLLNYQNVDVLAGLWLHAFACRAGYELVGQVAAAGAVCAVGYRTALRVVWTPEQILALPSEFQLTFVRVVTGVTLALAEGIADERLLRQAIVEDVNSMAEWCIDHPEVEAAMFASDLAEQLVTDLIAYSFQPPE